MLETEQSHMRGEQQKKKKKWKGEFDGPYRPVSLTAVVCKHMEVDRKEHKIQLGLIKMGPRLLTFLSELIFLEIWQIHGKSCKTSDILAYRSLLF